MIEAAEEVVKHRLKNNILSTFTFSWMIINWKAVIILTSVTEPFKERVEAVEDLHLGYCSIIAYPALTSLVVLIAVPFILYIYKMVWTDPIEAARNQELQRKKNELLILELTGNGFYEHLTEFKNFTAILSEGLAAAPPWNAKENFVNSIKSIQEEMNTFRNRARNNNNDIDDIHISVAKTKGRLATALKKLGEEQRMSAGKSAKPKA